MSAFRYWEHLINTGRLSLPMPLEAVRFPIDPGVIPLAMQPIPTMELRLKENHIKCRNAVLVEISYQRHSADVWFTYDFLLKYKGDFPALCCAMLDEGVRRTALQEKRVKQRYENIVRQWLKGREWSEECTCQDDLPCWYHLSEEAQTKARVDSFVDLLMRTL